MRCTGTNFSVSAAPTLYPCIGAEQDIPDRAGDVEVALEAALMMQVVPSDHSANWAEWSL